MAREQAEAERRKKHQKEEYQREKVTKTITIENIDTFIVFHIVLKFWRSTNTKL